MQMNILSASYGNDSVALIQWAAEQQTPDVTVTYIDTGWAAAGWMGRVEKCEAWVTSLGFTPVRLKAEMGFEELMRHKKGFPNQRYQWCSGLLKGLPFLKWVDEFDPECKATVLIGKRREESRERADTPEFIDASEYHGGRRVWHPLYLHTESMRDALLRRAGFEPLPHRSQECAPCVNANRNDFKVLTDNDIERVKALEAEVGKTMFRPKRHMGAKGIVQVVQWAKAGRGKFELSEENECSSGYCGH